jgi:Flp pilus assembly protein protease CpaA
MELIFLSLVLIWLVVACAQDFKKREIPNWLCFSLIGVVLAYQGFNSILAWNIWPFAYALFGLGTFFGLGELLYHSRGFGGGDAKLLMALGPVLSFASSIVMNLVIFGVFIFLLLFMGSIYGIVYSLVLVAGDFKKFRKEFSIISRSNKKMLWGFFIGAIAIAIIAFLIGENIFFVLALLVLAFPLLYAYAKTVEESFFIGAVDSKKVTVGDWLHESVKVGKVTIKPYWEGLSEKEVEMLRKKYKGKVVIKQGIPFAPSFLFAFTALIVLWNLGIIQSFAGMF